MKKVLSILLILTVCLSGRTFIRKDVHQNSGEFAPHAYMTEEEFWASDFEICNEDMRSSSDFSMKNYFKNLNKYSPVNSAGSCGYVSFIQYLAYYDTFYNDDVIAEQYERKELSVADIPTAISISPGVQRLTYPSTGLYNFIQSNKDTDFQMYLMDIVNSALGNSPDQYSYSIGMWSYYHILNKLFPNKNVTFEYRRVNSYGSKPTDSSVISQFDNYVKSKLDAGLPVMLHIAMYNEVTGEYDNYHSVVAYYYDSKGIHAHFGWGAGTSDVVISASYQITEAGVMNTTNIDFTHSNNYIINGVPYCGCGEHIHKYIYKPYDNTYHTSKCICGEQRKARHVVKVSEGGGRYQQCHYCKSLIDTSGEFFPGILSFFDRDNNVHI